MENIIRNYFQAWIDNNVETVKKTFSDDIVYTECYGPEYHGIEQVLKWFTDWHKKGSVLNWDIKQITVVDRTAFVEWFFRCEYEGNIDGFDGVTIARFNDDMKIYELKEFQSKSEHYYPYE
ncbi:MAG TPA: nuclear transport factor 2 family protein [Thermoclostridium sp.]|nr:nuclear transport factor 2 family protein [Clostridiaceae bacterium]HOQ76662.1 nuclear transport factor 2 family protein [Thermoclostridium sp.]